MSKPEFDRKKPDQESMFDFLSDDGQGRPARKKTGQKRKRKAMPTIRKPVPISKSGGPLKAPKPGEPVAEPPALTAPVTTGKSPKINNNLDFLDETQVHVPDLSPAAGKNTAPRAEAKRAVPPNNVRPLRKPEQSDEDAEIEREFSALSREKSSDEFEFDADWREGLTGHDLPEEGSRDKLVRWASWSAALLLLAGGGYYLYSSGQFDRLKSLSSDSVSIADSPAVEPDLSLNNQVGAEAATVDNTLPTVIDQTQNSIETAASNEVAGADESAVVEPIQQSPIALKFQEQLATVEGLIDNGDLTDAQSVLTNMDRTVYGYGAVEFAALEQRILEQRSAAEQSAEAALAAEAARLEAQRVAEEALAAELERVELARIEAERAEAEREEVLRLERQLASERLAAQRRVEQQRLEAERAAAARLEAERLTQQRAAAEAAQQLRIEQAAERRAQEAAAERLAREAESARTNTPAATTSTSPENSSLAANGATAEASAEAERAEKIRLDALEEAARDEARRQIVEADRVATAQRIAANVTPRNTNRDAIPQQRNTVSTGATARPSVATASSRPISDAELQTVYRRFTDLQDAISERDISKVVNLTKRSGLRVQQFMQVFENSSSIDVRIRNVSTSNATGEINGILQIRSIQTKYYASNV